MDTITTAGTLSRTPLTARRRTRQAGFTMIELIAVIVILSILAAMVVPRYMGLTDEAAQRAARGALAEGFNQFKLAHARYIIANGGSAPVAVADLAPDYLNATTSLGDYTVVFTQAGAGGDLTLEVYAGAATSGDPLATNTVPWP